VAERGKEGTSPLNFALSEKVQKSSCQKLFVQTPIFKTENPIWEIFSGKIEILSTHDLLCQKSSVSVDKLQFPATLIF